MAEPFEIGVRRRVSGDQYSDSLDIQAANGVPAHVLDGEVARKVHRKLMDWFFHERSKQSENRLQMALDSDYYDGAQWDPEDAEVVKKRGQAPLVFNEVAPMVDWLIGTERRNKVDWSVLPRTEDDVTIADAKTKTLKFVSDINRVPFARSRAFMDAIKCGVGWVDDGARDDPTQDVLYSKYEDWRNVLWDSSSYEYDLTDARYIFRWRWVDADIAEMMFPDRVAEIRRAVVDSGTISEGEIDADWYLGQAITTSGSMYASGDGVTGEISRRRIKLIECQFAQPAQVKIVGEGPMKGAHLGEHDLALNQLVSESGCGIIEKTMMRKHVAVFTEASMLSLNPSIYRHNRYSLTPIWCYRNGKTRLPYGAIRRVRDIQQDLNKRASRALFLLSTNQIIADVNAVADKQIARDEADQPDGYIEVAAGKKFEIRRDTEQATGQIQMMTLDAQNIQKSVGVNNDNLGRQTNAQSGEAIKARQIQGSVGTTEPFDNQRFAIQVQGEKQLSLTEQFYTEEKVIRLTGARGKIEWLKVNTPERQPDGSIRYLNDITASQSDFVVSEQDYAGTLRQAMFESMNAVAAKFPPELAIRFLRMAYEYSDMPNKDAIAEEIRKITGERDESKPMTPEEQQAEEQKMQQQSEAMAMQREIATLAIAKGRADVEKIGAEIEQLRAKSDGTGNGMAEKYQQELTRLQDIAATKLEAMAEQLRKVQADSAKQIMAIRQDADVSVECARIDADAKVRAAEINAVAKTDIKAINDRIAEIATAVGENTPVAKGEAKARPKKAAKVKASPAA